MSELNQAVVAAGNKDYKEFETILSKEAQSKISNKLETIINHIEKNMFTKEKDNE